MRDIDICSNVSTQRIIVIGEALEPAGGESVWSTSEPEVFSDQRQDLSPDIDAAGSKLILDMTVQNLVQLLQRFAWKGRQKVKEQHDDEQRQEQEQEHAFSNEPAAPRRLLSLNPKTGEKQNGREQGKRECWKRESEENAAFCEADAFFRRSGKKNDTTGQKCICSVLCSINEYEQKDHKPYSHCDDSTLHVHFQQIEDHEKQWD